MSVTLDNETYYTAKELSVKFNVSMETIRRWRKQNNLQGKLIGVRKYFYSENDVKQFIQGN